MENRLSKRTKRAAILLTIIMGLAAAGSAAGYRFWLAPQLAAYREQATRLAGARAEFARLNAAAQTFKLEADAREKARVRFEQLSARFPVGTPDGLFLAQIGRLAEQNRVGLDKFKPAPPVNLGFVRALPIEVELRGPYPSLLEMIDRLATGADYLEIRNLRLQSAQKPPDKTGKGPGSGGKSSKSAGSAGSAGEQEQGHFSSSGLLLADAATAAFVYAPAPPEEITAGMLLLIYFRPSAGDDAPQKLFAEEINHRAAARPDPFRPPDGENPPSIRLKKGFDLSVPVSPLR